MTGDDTTHISQPGDDTTHTSQPGDDTTHISQPGGFSVQHLTRFVGIMMEFLVIMNRNEIHNLKTWYNYIFI